MNNLFVESKTSKKARHIHIQPHGGLGNQLFMYFAGLYASEKCNRSLSLNLPLLHKSYKIHSGNISEFALKADCELGQTLWVTNRYQRYLSYLASRKKIPTKFRRFLGARISFYTQVGVGFDLAIDFLSNIDVMKGYFQTWRYFDLIAPERRRIFHDSSINALSLLPEYEYLMKENSIVLHIRRGDYLQGKNSQGILSLDYYCSAIQNLVDLGISSTVLVFTDDFASIEKSMRTKFNFDWVLADPNSQLSPAQTLELMSLGQHFVIANSTFSWWAARLSTRNGIVFAPQRWFYGLSDPEDLIPSNWKRLPSIWDLE